MNLSIYKGDNQVATGSVRTCANVLGVQEDTILFYLSPAYKRRVFVRGTKSQPTVAVRLDAPDPEKFRTCLVCERTMSSGYYCCDEYYCSEQCLNAGFVGTGETWAEHYSDDGDCYWTEWESESIG